MIEEADYGMTHTAFNNSAEMQGDEQLLVRFFSAEKQNMAKTEEEGRPIYDMVDWVEIHQPGNKLSAIMRIATDRDKQRFHRHWNAYKSRESQEELSGTPLEQWPGITKAQVAELKFLNVHSIEQLVNLSDGSSRTLLGIADIKRKAKAYLQAADQQKAANEIEATRSQLEYQKELNAKMAARLEALESVLGEVATPKKRGRPAKEPLDERIT